MARAELARRLSAEAIGTAFLLATVVGSGIMGETLSGGNDAVALLGNTVATGAILVVLILVFGNVSGAHFNPAVTMVFLIRGEISGAVALAYIVVQIASALVGTWAAHFMFEEVLMQFSTKPRTGLSQWFSEAVATFGLVMTILGTLRWRPDRVSYAVGLFITAGYWFTASTSFANPAVTVARAFTDTFSGIHPPHVPAFIVAQLVGAMLAAGVMGWLLRRPAVGE